MESDENESIGEAIRSLVVSTYSSYHGEDEISTAKEPTEGSTDREQGMVSVPNGPSPEWQFTEGTSDLPTTSRSEGGSGLDGSWYL